MLALDIAEERTEELPFWDLDPGASSPSITAANGPAYRASATYTYDHASGAILYEEFHPYGSSAYRAVDSTVEVSAKRYRYTGKERDEETGLDHMGARYYAGWLGRWTSADPIGLEDGVNRYAYVRGNPVGMKDPSGMFGEPGRPSQEEITQYEQAAEAHNTAVRTWHAEVATFDPEAKNAEYTGARLEREGAALVEREGALWKQWEDLATRNIQADIRERHEREFEEGNPDSLVSGRTLVRVGGATKISFGVTLALGGGVIGGVLGADFLQAGGRQTVSGEESATVVRGGTELISEAAGSSVREARIHGDIAETLLPASAGALQLGASLGRAGGGSLASTTNVTAFRFASEADTSTLLPNLAQASRLTQMRVNFMMRFGTYRVWRAHQHMRGMTRNSPFVSLVQDPARLAASSDPWARTIATGRPGMPGVQRAPDLLRFSIPEQRLVWPRPSNTLSITETELVFYGNDLPTYKVGSTANPF